MTRPIFWPSDGAYVLDFEGHPRAGAPVRIWSAQTGGTQVTDLQYVNASGTPTGAVPSGVLFSDANGLIPAFAGPDAGMTTLWGDHGFAGARLALSADPVASSGGGAVSSVAGRTGAVVLAESDVTNLTSDLAAKAPLASPALTGVPTVPTAAQDTSTTQAASTAFVLGQASSATPLMDGSPVVGTSVRHARADHVHPSDTSRLATSATVGGDLSGTLPNPTVPGLAGKASTTHATTHASAGSDPVTISESQVTNLTTDLAGKAPLSSPALTGTPTVPTAAVDTSTTQAASTAFVLGQAASASPAANGSASAGSSSRLARGDHVHPISGVTSVVGLTGAVTGSQIAGDSALTGAFVLSATCRSIVILTQAAYDALGTRPSTTFYVVVG